MDWTYQFALFLKLKPSVLHVKISNALMRKWEISVFQKFEEGWRWNAVLIEDSCILPSASAFNLLYECIQTVPWKTPLSLITRENENEKAKRLSLYVC